MPSETEISLILSQMDKTRHLMPQSSNSNPQQQQQGQQQGGQQQHYQQQQQQPMQFHHLPQMPPSSYDSHQQQQHNHPGFPPMPQSDIPVASTSSGHPHPQLMQQQQQQQQQQGQGQQQSNDPNNANPTNSPQHPPLPPLPPNVSPGRSRASRAAKSAAQIMAGLQQQRGREADNYISGLTGGANGSGEMGEEDDDDDGDDDVYEEDTAEAERDLAHDETMLAEEMLHMKNEGSQSGSQGNNNASSHQQQSQQMHQLPLQQDGSLSYDPAHHHQYLQQGHYPPIPSSTLPGIINPPPMPEPEIQVGTPATPADGDDGSDGDSQGGKNRPRGRKPKNQFGAGLQKDSSEYQKLRKENHKNVEKKRRETINDGIKRLSLLVPGADKNKSKIIAQAAEYIAELKEAEHGYIEKWTLEKLMLEQNLRDLSAQNEDLSRRLADKERRVAQLENGMGMGNMNGNGGNNGGM